MDCDGLKKQLLTDMDGSLFELFGGSRTPGSLISKSEYEWDGDPRRGLGDYRLPLALVSDEYGNKVAAPINKGSYNGRTHNFITTVYVTIDMHCVSVDASMCLY